MRSQCSECAGTVVEVEVVPVKRLEGPQYGKAQGAAVSGSLARVCSKCSSFQGQTCDKCGGRVLWEWHGPGQAVWVCESCSDSDIALHAPPRPVRWRCASCDMPYYSWGEPTQRICRNCRTAPG